jgi:hypothetical protein
MKNNKVCERSGAASQPPIGATSIKQRLGEEQRLRVGLGGKANPKVGQMVDLRAGLLGQSTVFKTELLQLAGEGDDQTELQL